MQLENEPHHLSKCKINHNVCCIGNLCSVTYKWAQNASLVIMKYKLKPICVNQVASNCTKRKGAFQTFLLEAQISGKNCGRLHLKSSMLFKQVILFLWNYTKKVEMCKHVWRGYSQCFLTTTTRKILKQQKCLKIEV